MEDFSLHVGKIGSIDKKYSKNGYTNIQMLLSQEDPLKICEVSENIWTTFERHII